MGLRPTKDNGNRQHAHSEPRAKAQCRLFKNKSIGKCLGMSLPLPLPATHYFHCSGGHQRSYRDVVHFHTSQPTAIKNPDIALYSSLRRYKAHEKALCFPAHLVSGKNR